MITDYNLLYSINFIKFNNLNIKKANLNMKKKILKRKYIEEISSPSPFTKKRRNNKNQTKNPLDIFKKTIIHTIKTKKTPIYKLNISYFSNKIQKSLLSSNGQIKKQIKNYINQLMCSICQSILQNPITTSCGHNFCNVCFKALTEEKNVKCPNCRFNLEIKEKEKQNKINTKANRNLKEILNSFFECPYNGCQKKTKLQNLMEHIENCNYKFILCPNKKCLQDLREYQLQSKHVFKIIIIIIN